MITVIKKIMKGKEVKKEKVKNASLTSFEPGTFIQTSWFYHKATKALSPRPCKLPCAKSFDLNKTDVIITVNGSKVV